MKDVAWITYLDEVCSIGQVPLSFVIFLSLDHRYPITHAHRHTRTNSDKLVESPPDGHHTMRSTSLLAVALGAMSASAKKLAHSSLHNRDPSRVLAPRQETSEIAETPIFTAEEMATWDAQTTAACEAQLSTLEQSSNPSGTCVCYNLPSLDADTGLFVADLRLYKVSDARGDFTGIQPADVQVGIMYDGATVQRVGPVGNDDEQTDLKRSDEGVESLAKRQSTIPELLQTYIFVGQIDESRMVGNMSE